MDKNTRIEDRGDWENALGSKFQDYEPAIPELPPFYLPNRRPYISRWKRIALSTSIAATIILTLFLIRENAKESDNPLSVSSSSRVMANRNENIIETSSTPRNLSTALHKRKKQFLEEDNKLVRIATEKIAYIEVSNEDTSETVAQNNDNSATKSDNLTDDLPSVPPKKSKENTRRLSFQIKRPLKLSVFTSGLTLNTDAVTMSQVGDVIIAEQKNDYTVQKTPLFEIGSTVLFSLTPKLSIQSGLKYSWYRIGLHDNSFISKDNYFLDVHSLGIPLDIQYTLYNFGAWSMYGQYGIGLNIPFKSTITGASINNGGATISLDTSFVLGLEYSITDQIGLYTSLGATYDMLRMKSNLPDADISRWHGKLEAGIRFRINR